MLSLVVGVCLVGSLAAVLPDVSVTVQDGAVLFSMQHVPGIKGVYFTYQQDNGADKVIPFHGKASRGDGEWMLKDERLSLRVGDSVQYSVHAINGQGKVNSPVNVWIYAPSLTPGPRRQRGAVVFRDDFNGNSLNEGQWDIETSMYGGYNWEFQVYTPEKYNVRTQNGNLMLCPTKTTDDPRWDENYLHTGVMDMNQLYGKCTESGAYGCNREGKNGLLPPVMSGKVKSKPTITFGYVEVRARIPKGDFLWPAIWMLPRGSEYGQWPRSGEIDIMESRGNTQPWDQGVGFVSSTLHWGTSAGDNHFSQTTGARRGGDFSSDFHTWRLEWTQDHLRTTIDNQEIMRVNVPGGGFSQLGPTQNIWHSRMGPFDKPFYLMLNVAVGGMTGFFPDNWNYGYEKPWKNDSPHGVDDFWANRGRWEGSWQGDKTCMEVDYIEMRNL